MSIKVSTTGSDVFLKGLGQRLTHPVVDEDLRGQFTLEEIIQYFDELKAFVDSNDLTMVVEDDLYGEYEVSPSELTVELLRESELEVASETRRGATSIELAALANNSLVHPDATSVGITSTSDTTRNIYASTALFQKWGIRPGDKVAIDTGAAAGTYTVESVTDQKNLIVVEAIAATATTGDLSVYHPTGSSLIGFDNTLAPSVSSTNLQDALVEIANASGGGDGYQSYEAIVDAAGGADYTSIKAALDDGATRIFVRAGIYVETDIIEIPNGGQLIGESATETVITFTDPTHYINIGVSGGNNTSSGTVSVSNASTTVTGTGTAFTSLDPGDYIELQNTFLKIASIANDTSLQLVSPFYQRATDSVSGDAFVAKTFNVGARVENITVVGGTSYALRAADCIKLFVRNFVSIEGGGSAGNDTIRIENSTECVVENAVVEGRLGTGFTIDNLTNSRFFSCQVKNCTNGFRIEDDCSNITYQTCYVFQCSRTGYANTGTNIFGIFLDACNAVNNGREGIDFSSGVSDVKVTGFYAIGGRRIIDVSGDNVLISGLISIDAGVNGIVSSGAGTVITDSLIIRSGNYGAEVSNSPGSQFRNVSFIECNIGGINSGDNGVYDHCLFLDMPSRPGININSKSNISASYNTFTNCNDGFASTGTCSTITLRGNRFNSTDPYSFSNETTDVRIDWEEKYYIKDSLAHNIAENSYSVVERVNNRIDAMRTYTDNSETTKIRETELSRSGNYVSQIVKKQYDETGTLLNTLTLDISRNGGKITSIERTES